MPAEPDRTFVLLREIEKCRNDPEFMARLRKRVAEDEGILDRLEDSRLTSLQAGLKAEVERLRRIQMHEEGMRGQWEREAPLQDDQAWAAQQVAGASKEAADRLENLLRESEGEK